MSRLLFNFLYASVCLVLLFICGMALATSVYVVSDEHGRPQFSDSKPDAPHQLKHIEVENQYPWSKAPPFKPSKKTKQKKRPSKPQKRYTLIELKSQCHAARGKYNNFRTTGKNIDWDTYRAKLEKYKTRRDEWCSRLLRGK